MSECTCSDTVRSNWGSSKDKEGNWVCLFCEKIQNSNEVKNQANKDGTVPKSPESEFPMTWERLSLQEKALESGPDAAARVFRYGSVFENVGKVLQTLNTIGFCIFAVITLLVSVPALYKLLGIVFFSFLWALAYLQTSFIRGLASYFQMRASEYFKK